MRKYFILVAMIFTVLVAYTYAFTPSQIEQAKTVANEYISGSLSDENWTGKNPHIMGEGVNFYTDADTPSYIEFKVSCDNNPNCGFIMVNVDGDDVAVPMASTNGNTPSETMTVQNGGSNNKNYYFGLYEQYSENKATGEIASIDPSDSYDIKSTSNKSEKELHQSRMKEKLNKSIQQATSYKKTDEFREIKKHIKDIGQLKPFGGEEVSIQKIPLFDSAYAQTGGYVAPTYASNTFVAGSSYMSCYGKVPCYNQFNTTYGTGTCLSGCVPTAFAEILGYYDRAGTWPNLFPGTAPTITNTDVQNWEHDLGANYMHTACSGALGGTSPANGVAGAIQYAKDMGYKNTIGTASASNIFSTLKSEINAGRPVMLGNSSHAMVAFGYYNTTDVNTQIARLNMGWGSTNVLYNATGAVFYTSNIDYNINAMRYNGGPQNAINSVSKITIAP